MGERKRESGVWDSGIRRGTGTSCHFTCSIEEAAAAVPKPKRLGSAGSNYVRHLLLDADDKP